MICCDYARLARGSRPTLLFIALAGIVLEGCCEDTADKYCIGVVFAEGRAALLQKRPWTLPNSIGDLRRVKARFLKVQRRQKALSNDQQLT